MGVLHIIYDKWLHIHLCTSLNTTHDILGYLHLKRAILTIEYKTIDINCDHMTLCTLIICPTSRSVLSSTIFFMKCHFKSVNKHNLKKTKTAHPKCKQNWRKLSCGFSIFTLRVSQAVSSQVSKSTTIFPPTLIFFQFHPNIKNWRKKWG